MEEITFQPRRWAGFIRLFVAGVTLLGLAFVYGRGVDINWDLLNYHYFTGYSLLHGNYLRDLAPAGLQSFLHPAPNLLSFLALSKLGFPAGAWALALVQLLSLPLLVLIARQIGRDLGFQQPGIAEFLALALCLLAPLWWSELGTSFADATTAPLVLLGLHLGLRGIERGEEGGRSILWAGGLFGLAVGLKLTNAPFALAFFAALLAVSLGYRWQQTLRLLLLLAVGMTIGVALTAWWNIYLLRHWGSPLFPLYNAWFNSPFADPVNFRDPRWHFNSFAEFARYLWETLRGTTRTSEVAFADGRIPLFLLLLALLPFFRGGRGVTSRVSPAFLLFLAVAFLVWALVFAYQRYLIPVELLLGLGIWVLLARLVGNRHVVALLLAGCLIAAGLLLKVPNWGHLPAGAARAHPFGVKLPEAVAATPARYLVVGRPISYILPFLHPESRFYGPGFSPQLDELIRVTVSLEEPLPLRVLAAQADAGSLRNLLSSFGFAPDRTSLSCAHFATRIDNYLICELDRRSAGEPQLTAPITIDFQDRNGGGSLPAELLGISGLSVREPWGSWSNGDEVVIMFADCLPAGQLEIAILGRAFGPNVGRPVKVILGEARAELLFGEEDRDLTVTLENGHQCRTELSLLVPQKISPLEMGLNPDRRSLGIGLVRLELRGPR